MPKTYDGIIILETTTRLDTGGKPDPWTTCGPNLFTVINLH